MTKEILIKSAIRLLVNEQIKQGSWGYALEEDSAYEVSWKDVLNWLEQQPNRCDSCIHSEEQDGSNCYECVKGMADNFEVQSCEDCISRQAAIDVVRKWFDKIQLNGDICLDGIASLPSVTPQKKSTGSWVEKQVVDNEEVEIEQWQSARCSKCDKYHTTPYLYYFDDYNYCPNCGAKMEVADEKSNDSM